MQKMLNVDEPDYGHLFDDMHIENDAFIKIDSLISPKVEAEIGFVLSGRFGRTKYYVFGCYHGNEICRADYRNY